MPTFVPVIVASEEEDKISTERIITIEFGGGVMMRVPGDTPDNRVMALVRALRNASFLSPASGYQSRSPRGLSTSAAVTRHWR